MPSPWPLRNRAATNGFTSTQAMLCTAGKQLISGWVYSGSSPVPSGVTDTAGNTYGGVGSIQMDGAGSGSNRVALYRAYNITGHASNVATLGLTSGSISFVWGFLIELDVVDASDPVQGSNGSSGSGTAVSTGTIPVTDPSVIIAIAVCNGASILGSNGYYHTPFIGSFSQFISQPFKIVTASEACTLTQPSATWAIAGGAFKVPVSAGGGGGMRIAGHGGLAA